MYVFVFSLLKNISSNSSFLTLFSPATDELRFLAVHQNSIKNTSYVRQPYVECRVQFLRGNSAHKKSAVVTGTVTGNDKEARLF